MTKKRFVNIVYLKGKSLEKKYRHEYKYLSPEYILSYLQKRVGMVLQLDPHTGDAKQYSIRSIYFDDMYNTCYRENENGTDPREKFRIRIYNGSTEHIKLELKQKEKTKCFKYSAPLSFEQCKTIMQGKIPQYDSTTPFLVKKLIARMKLVQLRPVCIVSYERVPYIWTAGNVRITFDRNIRSSSDINEFFSKELPARPVLESGINMVEVKFDELLPDFIYELLQSSRLVQTAFSKYYLCRRYNMTGESI